MEKPEPLENRLSKHSVHSRIRRRAARLTTKKPVGFDTFATYDAAWLLRIGRLDQLFDFDDASDNPTFYADLNNPQSLNKYQYTYNNPYKCTDPTGHCPPIFCIPAALYIIHKLATPIGPRERKTNAEAAADILDILPGGKVGGILGGILLKEVTKAAKQSLKQAVKEIVQQPIKLSVEAAKKSRPSKQVKLKKERSAQGAQDQREGLHKAQQFHRKQKRPDKIRSTKKSVQDEKTELRRIKNLKDAEEKFKPWGKKIYRLMN